MKESQNCTDIRKKTGKQNILIIGSDEETSDLLFRLKLSDHFNDVRHIFPTEYEIKNSAGATDLDIIINASTEPSSHQTLKGLNLKGVKILSNLCAELLLSTALQDRTEKDLISYRSNILKCLKEMRRTVFLTRNREELFKLILSHAIEALSADSGSIMLTDPKQRLLKIEMAYGIDKTIISSTVQKIGKGIAGKVARNCKPLIIHGKAVHDKESSEFSNNDSKSALSAPLTLDKMVVGVINISRKQTDELFHDGDLQFLIQLANLAAGIVQTSKEFEVSRLNALSHSILTDTREILHLDYPLQERLNLLMMKLTNSLNGKICNLYKFDKESGTFLVQSSSSFDLNKKRMTLIRLNDFFTGRALRNNESFTYCTVTRKNNQKKWFIAHPIFCEGEISELLIFHCISEKDNVELERKILSKIATILEQEFTKNSYIEHARISTIKYSALSEIAFDMAAIHNIRHLAKLIVANACLILEAESCILSLYNNNMDCYENLESFSFRGPSHIKKIIKTNDKLTFDASTTSDAILVNDLYSKKIFDDIPPVRSVLCMCLRQSGKVLGSLSVFDKNHNGFEHTSFSIHDKEVFSRFATHATKLLNRFLFVK